jgi:hypothetical protein
MNMAMLQRCQRWAEKDWRQDNLEYGDALLQQIAETACSDCAFEQTGQQRHFIAPFSAAKFGHHLLFQL